MGNLFILMKYRSFIAIALIIIALLGFSGCAKKSWHEVARFEGSTDQVTEVFNVPKNAIESMWIDSVDPLSEDFYFKFELRREGEEEDQIFGMEMEGEPGMELTQSAPSGCSFRAIGNLYFDIEAKDCNWIIIVKSFY